VFLLLALVFMVLSWIFALKCDKFNIKKDIVWFVLAILFGFLDVLFCTLHFIL